MSSLTASLPFPRAAERPVVNPWIIAVTVTLATFMELLDTAIANVSLPHIAGGLAVSYDESTCVLTGYLVSNADRKSSNCRPCSAAAQDLAGLPIPPPWGRKPSASTRADTQSS